MIKVLRINQWSKNLLIFVVMFAANSINFTNVSILSILFFSFSLIVSSTYILNDLVDIQSDQNHPTKKNRPLASGKLSKNKGVIIMIILFLIGNVNIFFLNQNLLVYSFSYVFFTLIYSFKLKYLKYADLINISILFLIRLSIGGEALSINISLALYIFVFFSSLGVVTGKKLSILENKEIVNSKVKVFLQANYTNSELKNLMNSSLILSIITYAYWVILVKAPYQEIFSVATLLISLIVFCYFIFYFIYNSYNSNTEEIIEMIVNDKKVFFSLVLFLGTFFVGNL
jgi:decaprenyl-phosphate phosphoribosyltransferase